MRKLILVQIACWAAFALITAFAYRSVTLITIAGEDVSRTVAYLGSLDDLLIALNQAETAERGYIISGDDEFLEPFKQVRQSLPDLLLDIRSHIDTDERSAQEQLLRDAAEKLAWMEDAIQVRREYGADSASGLIREGGGEKVMDRIRAASNKIQASGLASLERRRAAAHSHVIWTATSVVILILVCAIFVSISSAANIRGTRRRVEAERRSEEASLQMAESIEKLEATTRSVKLMNSFGEALQICFSTREAYEVLARYSDFLFPGSHGRLMIINNSRNLLEVAHSWNGAPGGDLMFAPDKCLALRAGKIYAHEAGALKMSCSQVIDGTSKSYICIPLSAQGETLGALHLETGLSEVPVDDERRVQLCAIAEHTAMAIANLKLRDKLKSQSILDPLTGLFNRRYMESSFEREFYRAERSGKPLGVMMIDLDHFKVFNDTFGHEAGDVVLREAAAELKRSVRREDIVCRYGGEELLVILPEAAKQDVRVRAEQVCERIKNLRVHHGGQLLGTITASVGVAVFPNDTNERTELVSKADLALYQAKHAGRNCVVVLPDDDGLAMSVTSVATAQQIDPIQAGSL